MSEKYRVFKEENREEVRELAKEIYLKLLPVPKLAETPLSRIADLSLSAAYDFLRVEDSLYTDEN